MRAEALVDLNAIKANVETLKKTSGTNLLAVVKADAYGHGLLPVAKAALDVGFYISLSGILTFKTAQDLRDVASYVPLDRLLIETDSPYLAPVPYRGKTNTPAYVPHVAECLASVKGVSIETVADQTTANFHTLFNKVPSPNAFNS